MGDVVDFKRPKNSCQKKKAVHNKKAPLNIWQRKLKGFFVDTSRTLLQLLKKVSGFLLKWMIILTSFLALVEWAVDRFYLPPFYSALIFISLLLFVYLLCSYLTHKAHHIRNILN